MVFSLVLLVWFALFVRKNTTQHFLGEDAEQVSQQENLHLRTPENSNLTGGERQETSQSSEVQEGCGTHFGLQRCEQVNPERRHSPSDNQHLSGATSDGRELVERACDENFSLNVSQRKSVQRAKKTFICRQCGIHLRSSSFLCRHLQEAHKVGTLYICPNCGERFMSNSGLSKHKKSHKGEKPHQCRKCGKSFKYKWYLDLHRRIHIEEKTYECSDSGKYFIFQSNLSEDKKSHTGEKLHKF
ncbi:zinc finger protein 16-like isoform X2 [Heteronotia binoei]|uniref:zinc finger protein 16-like isoform X2 n=1 Tax=Heteronotia binoei TaxID=13085 RepID=UPI00292DFCA1|nr:zinc finger protein 16-like isoform X2 [Heteronotia binoei]